MEREHLCPKNSLSNEIDLLQMIAIAAVLCKLIARLVYACGKFNSNIHAFVVLRVISHVGFTLVSKGTIQSLNRARFA